MFVTWPILVILGLGFFLIGTVVGSFLNVCIYRIPWQKSVIWPGSRCPGVCSAIAARDNIPIVSWIALRGECRSCGAADLGALSPGGSPGRLCLFLGAYLVDVIAGPRGAWGQVPAFQLAGGRLSLPCSSPCWSPRRSSTTTCWIIPDQITVTGMVVGRRDRDALASGSTRRRRRGRR